MSRKVRKYDKEFKLNAVNLCLSSDRGYGEIAKDLGIPGSTLHSWVEAHQKDGKEAFPGKGHLKASDKEVAQLRKELAIAQGASNSARGARYIKKSLRHFLFTAQMKFKFMKSHEGEFSIERMSEVFEVSRSGYYKFVYAEPSKRSKENDRLLKKKKEAHKASRETYGSPRIHAELYSQGETCSRKRVSKLMRKEGVKAKMRKRFKVTTKVNPKAKAAPNLLQQDFTAEAPNQRWVAGLTYVATGEGWLYVATVLDLFSGKIVGLAMDERMTAELVLKALEQAILHREPKAGLIHHSGKGSQYTSQDFQALLVLYGFIASMSGTGNCFDNAVMESFFHTLKTEHIYFEHYETRSQAKASIFEDSMIFYNKQGRHSALGYLSPEMFESRWYQKQNLQLSTVY